MVRLVLVLLFIGWKTGASLLSQSLSVAIAILEPEKFSTLTGFVKITFITARITASLDCPLIIIITLNNNGEPLQKSLIFCFPWLNITWYLEMFSLFLLLLSIVYYFFFLISVHGKNIWNNLHKQEHINRSLPLPYKPSESTFARIFLFLEHCGWLDSRALFRMPNQNKAACLPHMKWSRQKVTVMAGRSGKSSSDELCERFSR